MIIFVFFLLKIKRVNILVNGLNIKYNLNSINMYIKIMMRKILKLQKFVWDNEFD